MRRGPLSGRWVGRCSHDLLQFKSAVYACVWCRPIYSVRRRSATSVSGRLLYFWYCCLYDTLLLFFGFGFGLIYSVCMMKGANAAVYHIVRMASYRQKLRMLLLLCCAAPFFFLSRALSMKLLLSLPSFPEPHLLFFSHFSPPHFF